MIVLMMIVLEMIILTMIVVMMTMMLCTGDAIQSLSVPALNFYFDYAIQRLQVTIILSKIDKREIMVIFY